MNVRFKHLRGILATLLVSVSSVNGYTIDQGCQYNANDCCVDYCNQNCSRFRIEGDYLYWQLRQPWSSYSIERSVSEDVTINKDHTFQLGYNSGFRLGLYYDNLFCCLDLGVRWTSYHVDETKSRSFSSNESPSFSFDGVLASLKDTFQVDLDYIDIDFSRSFSCASCFTIRPHIGVRLWQLDFKEKLRANGTYQSEADVSLAFRRTISDEDRGIGLEGGLWGEWQIGCGLSLVGHFGGSVLSYKDDYHRKTKIYATNSSDTVVFNDITIDKDDVQSSNQTFDYYLGLQYKTDLCGRDVSIKLGWEHLHSNYEYFEFEGLTTGIAINF